MNEAIEFFVQKVKKLESVNLELVQEKQHFATAHSEAVYKIRELDAVITELQDQQRELQKEYDSAREHVEELQGEYDASVHLIETLDQRLCDAEKDASERLSPCVLESYKQQVEALYKKWQRESDRRKMWESEAKNLKQEVSKLKLELQEKYDQDYSIEDHGRALHEIAELRAQLATLMKIHVKSLEDMKRKEARLEFYEAEAKYRHEQVEKSEKELKTACETSDHFQNRCRANADRANKLQDEVTDLREQLKYEQNRADKYQRYYEQYASKWYNAQERLKNANVNRKWCDAATEFLGPFAEQLQMWYDRGSELFELVEEIADGWNKPGAKYPWAKDLNTTGEEKSSSP